MLELETLESRDTPSITLVGTTVHVVGTDGPDTVIVYRDFGQLGNNVTVAHYGTTPDGTFSYEKATFTPEQVAKVHAVLRGGNDLYLNFIVDAVVQDDVDGGDGNDFLFAGHYGAELHGGAGNDWLFSNYPTNGAPVLLDGGAGVDLLFCAKGTTDVVLADPLDTVFGFDLAEDTFIDPVP